jgi:hypothetical protein
LLLSVCGVHHHHPSGQNPFTVPLLTCNI